MAEVTQITPLTPVGCAFALKGGTVTVPTLHIKHLNWRNLEGELRAKIQQAPNFFHRAPILIDFSAIGCEGTQVDLSFLTNILAKSQLIPVGVKHAPAAVETAALALGLAIWQPHATGKPDPTAAASHTTCKVVSTPVRSGQQVYAPDGDLIIVSAVSPGAELLAVGNIHVYGTLRGRALAGVNGETSARIFCNSLEAELLSIAGQYKVSEDLAADTWQCQVMVTCNRNNLVVSKI